VSFRRAPRSAKSSRQGSYDAGAAQNDFAAGFSGVAPASEGSMRQLRVAGPETMTDGVNPAKPGNCASGARKCAGLHKSRATA
jgi:hypothetical protein